MRNAVRNGQCKGTPPLLIVGGFYPLLTPMPLGLAAGYFRRSGRRVWILPHSVRSMRDIRLRARLTAELIDRVLRETGSEQLDILAFSMGGLAALMAIQKYGLGRRVRTFVAYSSPFQGVTSSLAVLIFSAYFAKMAGQMLPGSRLIREMLDAGLPAGPRYVSVGGDKDWLCPPECTRLPGAEHATCHHGHLDFLANSRVFVALEPFLR
jgi:pimeloyl-ACP methyl ester carboxylesterase